MRALLPVTLFQIPRRHKALESIKEFLISTITAGKKLKRFCSLTLSFTLYKERMEPWGEMIMHEKKKISGKTGLGTWHVSDFYLWHRLVWKGYMSEP